MRSIFLVILGLFLTLPPASTALEKGLTVNGVRYFSYPAFTRIVLELENASAYTVNRSPDGRAVLVAAYEGPLLLKTALPAVRDSAVTGLESREDAGRQVIMIRLDASAREVKDFVLRGPDRIVLDIEKGAQAPLPAATPDRQLIVMLDPGHGGKDTGIVTGRGQEKTITLETAHAVKRILQKDPLFKVLMTRDRDAYMTLDERAAAANAAGARMFVSIHAASAGAQAFIQDPDEALAGQAPQQPLARDFLGFEAGSEQEEHRWGSQQAGHARESGALGRMFARQFAGSNEAEPVQAPIAVLRPVDAAAVLVEVGSQLDPAMIALSIARGIESYVRENR
jgi:N-acetylmuramoyl-L-alanine amidase